MNTELASADNTFYNPGNKVPVSQVTPHDSKKEFSTSHLLQKQRTSEGFKSVWVTFLVI